MINFDFYSPTKIFFGKERENEVGEIIKGYGFKKVLLHYGQNSIKKTGLYDKVVTSLNKANVDFIELSGVEPNPKIALVRKGVKLAKEEQVDFILAVGGGSVIDSAKAIACGAKVDFDPWLFNLHQKTPTDALKVGVILTISAAGSELSNSCVISDLDTYFKNGFNSDHIRPLFAIENPELTYSVSKFQTGCGIVDILMHTIERYFTDTPNIVFAKNVSEGLIKSVIEAGYKAIENPYDYEARSTLMIASSFSHNGLTGLGGKMYFTVHKLEHQISGTFDNVAHGAGLSVLFPAWAKWIYKKDLSSFVRFAKNIFNISNGSDEEIALNGILALEDYFKNIGMPTRFSDLGIYEDSFEAMASRITKNDTVKVVGFIELDKNAVLEIFNLAK